MRRALGSLTATLLMFALAACGDDSGGGSSSGDGGGTQRVSVGLTSLHSWWWPLLVADKKGFMKENNIDLDIVQFGSPGPVNNALASGDIQFTASDPSAVFELQRKESDIKIVGTAMGRNPYVLVGANGLKSVKDLKGGVIGVSGPLGTDANAVAVILDHAGMSKSDAEFIPAGDTSARLSALKAGTIQATVQFEPNLSLLTAGGAPVLARASDIDQLENSITMAWATKQSFLDKEPQAATNFAKGWIAGVAWLYEPANKDEAIDMLATEMKVDDKAAVGRAYDDFVTGHAWPDNSAIDQTAWDNTIANAKIAGAYTPEGTGDLYDESLFVDAAKD